MARARIAAKPRASALKPITFVPVEQVFSPMVKVRATRDLNGWADRRKRVKWFIPAGQIGMLDEDHAREFHTKGYVQIIDGSFKPVSADEADEMLSTVTTLNLGGPNG